MVNRELVIKGLRHCVSQENKNCFKCPYNCQCAVGNYQALKRDALALLEDDDNQIHHMKLIIDELEKELEKRGKE